MKPRKTKSLSSYQDRSSSGYCHNSVAVKNEFGKEEFGRRNSVVTLVVVLVVLVVLIVLVRRYILHGEIRSCCRQSCIAHLAASLVEFEFRLPVKASYPKHEYSKYN